MIGTQKGREERVGMFIQRNMAGEYQVFRLLYLLGTLPISSHTLHSATTHGKTKTAREKEWLKSFQY